MSYPITDSIIEFKTSCTIDDAVAKLLGWLKGPIYISSIRVDQPITLEHLENLDSLVFSITDHLESLRDEAIYKYDDAISADAPEDVRSSLLEAYGNTLSLIERANLFIIDINEELNKKDSSSLTIDSTSNVDDDKIRITIKSLDQWAKKKYGIAVLEDGVLPVLNSSKQKTPKSADKPFQRQQERAILEMIGKLGEDPKNLPKNPPGKPGIKAKVRKTLINETLFAGSTVFDKAWGRLRDDEDIQDKE